MYWVRTFVVWKQLCKWDPSKKNVPSFSSHSVHPERMQSAGAFPSLMLVLWLPFILLTGMVFGWFGLYEPTPNILGGFCVLWLSSHRWSEGWLHYWRSFSMIPCQLLNALLFWTSGLNAVKPHLHDTTCCQTRLTTGCIVYTAGCQTACTTRFDNRLNEQWLFIQHGCQTGCQMGLTTGCIV